MSLATVKDVGKAAAFSDRFLARLGVGREYVVAFWLEHTPEGRHYARTHGIGSDDFSDWLFRGKRKLFVEAITDCQSFVFSDVGDRLAEVPERPATDEEMDGWLGQMTWRRMEQWVDHVTVEPGVVIPETSEYVIFAGEKVAVDGVSVISFDEPDGLDLPKAQRKKWRRQKGYSKWPKKITSLIGKSKTHGTMLFFGHWDVCSSARKCFRVLLAVKLGSSFGIDGDGTVWWWSDPGLVYGWHGGEANRHALLSADLQNPVSLKYAEAQELMWGKARPVLRVDKRQRFGRGKGFLGMYEAQIIALLRILKVFAERTGYPLIFPTKVLSTGNTGEPFGRNMPWLFRDYHGCATHRHLPKTTKWDIRAFEFQIVILLLLRPKYREEFPSLVEDFRIDDPWAQRMHDEFVETCRWSELGIGVAA